MTCCSTPFQICEAFANCFTGLKVKVPAFSGEDMNAIVLTNNQDQGNIFGYTADQIVDGFITPDIALLADSFLNQFGGPYSIGFINNAQDAIEFTASDGQTYDGITFAIGKKVFTGTPPNEGVLIIDVMP